MPAIPRPTLPAEPVANQSNDNARAAAPTSTQPLDVAQALARYYPFWNALPQAMQASILAGRVLRLGHGQTVFDEGKSCQGFPCVLSGTVRVFKLLPNGRELLLYRVQPGESCVISCNCLIGRHNYQARGEAQGETQLLLLPNSLFDSLLGQPVFRDYVLGHLAERLAMLMTLVEEVAFKRLDQRLVGALLQSPTRLITRTHQQLADELGSVREMVSRLLKHFAEQGCVRLGREQIEILEPDKLRRLVGL